MDIRISKQSEVPLRQQLAEQIVFHIATGKLQPGQALPSVRELARRLKIHHNTVSEAYQDLIRRMWLVGRRGSHVTVRALEEGVQSRQASGLDDLINTLIRVAREQGHSLQSLRERVREQGGQLEIQSNEMGAMVTVRMPFAKSRSDTRDAERVREA